jgi:hypothetical protein
MRVFRFEHAGCGPVTHLNVLLKDSSDTLEEFTLEVDGRDSWPNTIVIPSMSVPCCITCF